ncbi:MAG: hypothetical protein QM736_09800 [Vicinamibacterales bacterium]
MDRPEGAVRMAIKSFDEVEFLTYRQDSPSSVACGAQTPAYRVLATFRTDIPVDGAKHAEIVRWRLNCCRTGMRRSREVEEIGELVS